MQSIFLNNKIEIMFRNISWLNYGAIVTGIIRVYYLAVFVIYYAANIKNIISFPFAWMNELNSKSQTENRELQSEASNNDLNYLASETGLNEAKGDLKKHPV